MPSFHFHKKERLTNKKEFEKLFSSGLSVNCFPLKIIYHIQESAEHTPPLQFAFTVPKRLFRKAVQRNYLKRRMKEAFRLSKHELYPILEEKNISITGIIIYINKEKSSYHTIEKAWNKGLKKLTSQIQKN